jgi:hypothetical protein
MTPYKVLVCIVSIKVTQTVVGGGANVIFMGLVSLFGSEGGDSVKNNNL